MPWRIISANHSPLSLSERLGENEKEEEENAQWWWENDFLVRTSECRSLAFDEKQNVKMTCFHLKCEWSSLSRSFSLSLSSLMGGFASPFTKCVNNSWTFFQHFNIFYHMKILISFQFEPVSPFRYEFQTSRDLWKKEFEFAIYGHAHHENNIT